MDCPILDDILRREGGFVDHPADRGGPTKFGITQATLSAWRGRAVGKEDIRRLTEKEAREILYVRYVLNPGFERIDDINLKALLVDCAVQHGQSRAIVWLQKAVGVKADGILGPVTADAVARADAKRLYCKVLALRAIHFGEVLVKWPSQHVFAGGWMHRLAEFIEKVPT